MADNGRVSGRSVRRGAKHGGRTQSFAVGERVTIAGFHKNYQPVIAEIDGELARVRTEELPGGDPLLVRVRDLEKIIR